MEMICRYCAAQNEPDGERCARCGMFYDGTEEVVVTDESVVQAKVNLPADTSLSETTSPSEPVEATDVSKAAGDDDTETAAASNESDEHSGKNSEEFVRPRKLSPQFRRRVEMTWQPSLEESPQSSLVAAGMRNAESTLSSHSATKTHSATSTLSIGTRRIATTAKAGKADYELKTVIGEGSMGKVWSARQTSLDRNVAVKRPRPELAGSGSIGESQFISEVVVTGQLEHPNIVPIYDLARDAKGVPFYSMKHVQGLAWNELIEQKTLQENLEILMKVCDAIAFAHDRNFLHRDIKPHNVMVGEFGEVSVMDWGIAVSLKPDPDKPWAAIATGPAGTPAYMAPEMAAHNPSELGVVSDVYLLGAALYEIVTGHPPHPRSGETREALLAAAANDIVPTDKTGDLVDIARRAMATKVDDRYQSVKEFQDALREYQSHRESIALSENADRYFASAEESGSSDEYARARFAYEEAIRLWPGNSHANRRLRAATIAHAANALNQENFELGISILDADNPDHRDVLGKLERRRASRRRLHWFSKIAALTAVGAILAVALVTVSKNRELDKQYAEARLAKLNAEENEQKAQDAKKEAEDKEKLARQAELRAKQSRDAALAAKVEARRAEADAQMERRKAEIAAYASDIGLAAESIRRNAYNKATAILNGMKPTGDPKTQTMRARLRHLEWGLLEDASKPGPVENVLGGDRVIAVASSDDGRVIAAGIENGTATVWLRDETDRPLSDPIVIDLAGQVSALTVSRDGRYLATAAANDTGESAAPAIHIWEVDAQHFESPMQRLTGHTAEVLSLSFSPDAKQLVSSGADRTARVWTIGQPQPIAVMRDHLDRRVWNATFSPDQKRVVTACDDGRVRVWAMDADNGTVKKVNDLRGHDGPVYAAAFSSDGRQVYSGGYDRRLLCWDLDENVATTFDGRADAFQALLEGSRRNANTVVQIGDENQQHEASIRCISTTTINDVEYVLTGGNDNTLRLWHATGNDWTLDKILRGHGRWVRSCAFTEHGNRIASGAHDGMKLWRWQDYSMPRELSPIAERRFGKDPSEMGASAATESVYSRDGRWVATAYENGTIALWDMSKQDRAASQLLVDGHALLTVQGQFSDHGDRLMTSAGDNTTRIWDVDSGTQRVKLHGTGWRGAASIHWDDDRVTANVVTGSDNPDAPAWVWKIKNQQVRSRRPLVPGVNHRSTRGLADVTAIEHATGGAYVVLGDTQGQCLVISAADFFDDETVAGSNVGVPFAAHNTEIRAIAVAPDSRSFFTADADGDVKWWRFDKAADTDSVTPEAAPAVDSRRPKLLTEFPWAGPVTALDVSDDGDQLIIGHEPGDGQQLPVARLFHLDEDSPRQIATLEASNRTGSRQWTKRPAVQSVQFVDRSRRALVSLFFPTGQRSRNDVDPSNDQWRGYQVGYWDWRDATDDFKRINVEGGGEISSAVLHDRDGLPELLVVGGKGARLWQPDRDEVQFTKLAGSYRPSATITTVDFAYDRTTGISRRLVAGDRDGGVRVWELDGDRWSEQGAAAHLVGQHHEPVVSTAFVPGREDRFVSADRSGQWILWQYDQRWNVIAQSATDPTLGSLHCMVISPDGHRLFAGTDRGSVTWQDDKDGGFTAAPKRWDTGSVVAAQYSSEGAWLVTSDGDRSVAIWDTNGNPLSRLSDEDAKGTAAMCFTNDRRRFVTGHHDRRIVIWDTSRLVDQPDDAKADSYRTIKELLTLEEHRRGVTSVSISPNGRDVVTAGEEGRTIVWSGAQIVPVSLSPSHNQLTYRPDGQNVRLDDGIILSDPSHLANYREAVVSIEIIGTPAEGEKLSLADASAEKHRVVETRPGGNDQLNVVYQPYPGADQVMFGTVLSTSDERSLRVRFNERATTQMVQAMLRSVTYRFRAAEPDTAAVKQPVDSLTQLAGNGTRTVRIEIHSVRPARDRWSDVQPPRPEFLPNLEADLEIEIDATFRGGHESDRSPGDGHWAGRETRHGPREHA